MGETIDTYDIYCAPTDSVNSCLDRLPRKVPGYIVLHFDQSRSAFYPPTAAVLSQPTPAATHAPFWPLPMSWGLWIGVCVTLGIWSWHRLIFKLRRPYVSTREPAPPFRGRVL